ncbi:SRPBCC family protein [Vannielia litorea]|uniref:SRPBCC family protein n=1 Tax=Vannielia litorea TaxID=1217970 RepID=UPI001BCCDA1F|nr:SRPBCC family protein [Vannielia litorea]MBS8224867.1 SRPBCC family protein [Vannielia litorea]
MQPLALRGLLFVLYALVAYGVMFELPERLDRLLPNAGLSPVSALLIVLWLGLGLGLAGQLVFDWHRRHRYSTVLLRTSVALLSVAVLLALLWIETVICVAIILPVAVAEAALGIWLTRLLLARFEARTQLCVALFALPFAAPFLHLPLPEMSERVAISTSITIEAPAAVIRAEAENVSDIAENEHIWTFTHSILRAPRPVSAHTSGGIRHARWTKGVRFEEHLLPGPDFAWRFAFPEPELLRAIDPRISPTGPEVVMLEGRYAFEPLGSARTRVTLTTTYQLNTPINAYLKPWGRLFLNDMHRAVLHVIANRAEARP